MKAFYPLLRAKGEETRLLALGLPGAYDEPVTFIILVWGGDTLQRKIMRTAFPMASLIL